MEQTEVMTALLEIPEVNNTLVGYSEVGTTLLGSNKLTYAEVLIGDQMTFEIEK